MKAYREKKYYCGEFLEVDVFPILPCASGRAKKNRVSRDTQKMLNKHNSVKKLTRILNSNFTANDLKFELTYAPLHNPEDDERAKKDLQNFLRRLKRFMAKRDIELKYVAVTEKGSRKGRYHHHVICNGGITPKDIADVWGMGYVQKILPLQFSNQGLAGIAEYFTKKSLWGKSWCASRNLKKPIERKNDSRISARRARTLFTYSDSRTEFEKLYPDYIFTECKTFYNQQNGGYYLCISMYKKTARIMC